MRSIFGRAIVCADESPIPCDDDDVFLGPHGVLESHAN